MTYPIQPGPFFRAASNWGKPPKHFVFLRSSSFRTDVMTVHSLQYQQHHHHEESHLIYGPLASSLLDQGFPVEYRLVNSIRLTQEQLYVTPKIGYVDCDAKFRANIQLLHLWTTFSGDIHASPRDNQNHYNVPVLNQQTRLLLHL